MRLVFGVLAAILFVIGAALFIGAVNLIPTDLGLVYLQGGTTVITGGAIILAIGFSAPKHRGLQRRRVQAQTKPSSFPVGAQSAMAQDGSSYPVMHSLTPHSMSETRGETQRDSLMAAFERDLETPHLNQGEALTPAMVPYAQSTNTVADDASPQITKESPTEFLPEGLAAEEGYPFQVKKPELAKFDLPPLDMTIGTLEQEPQQEMPASVKRDNRDNNPQEQPIPFSGDEKASAQQEVQHMNYAERYATDENTPYVEASEPQLAPTSELEVVGSYESAGTYFTMYSDGSVVTSGEEGERRFHTLDALRAYLAAKSGPQ